MQLGQGGTPTGLPRYRRAPCRHSAPQPFGGLLLLLYRACASMGSRWRVRSKITA